MVAKFSPYENTALGIRSLSFSQNKQYVVAGYCDGRARMYNALSWKEIYKFEHGVEEVNDENSRDDTNIFIEHETREGTIY